MRVTDSEAEPSEPLTQVHVRDSHTRSGAPRFEWLMAALVSGLLVFVSQFHRLNEFGLYEDDYYFISRAMSQDIGYLLERARVFQSLPQGRPFGFFLPDLLSFVGDKLGGLTAIYVLGFMVVTLNTWLCYRLLRFRMPPSPAAAGAAAFCLFPVDTTKILLTHDFQLQPSLTFALLSAVAYAGGRLWLAYPLSAGALLSYESGFLALFGLPLLLRPWDRSLPRELARHVALLACVFVGAAALRLVAAESRVSRSIGGISEILPSLLGSLVLGPARSLAGMLVQPLRTLPAWEVRSIVVAASGGLGMAFMLWWLARRMRPVQWASVVQVLAAGAAMLVLGYGLAFTHFPPNALVGRGTSVHLGATLGMSVLVAGITWALLQWHVRFGAMLVGAYFALAVGYYVTIQNDFVRSWQLQRAFWQQVATCCSDLEDGTVVVFEVESSFPTTFIDTNSWADALILAQTFDFPDDWTRPPRLFSLTRWQDRVEPDDAGLRWWVPGATWDEHWEPLPQRNVIVLRRANGELIRQTGSLDVAGRTLTLKEPGPPQAWPPAQLHDLLLQ